MSKLFPHHNIYRDDVDLNVLRDLTQNTNRAIRATLGDEFSSGEPSERSFTSPDDDSEYKAPITTTSIQKKMRKRDRKVVDKTSVAKDSKGQPRPEKTKTMRIQPRLRYHMQLKNDPLLLDVLKVISAIKSS